ncbi:MAG: hypothetical protein AAB284_03765 [Chloroflexota bacterium]
MDGHALIQTLAVVIGSPVETDERDRARRHALLGELAVAGIPSAYLSHDARVEDLFRESAVATAS